MRLFVLVESENGKEREKERGGRAGGGFLPRYPQPLLPCGPQSEGWRVRAGGKQKRVEGTH